MSEQCKACGQSWWVADPVTGECPGCRIAALEAEIEEYKKMHWLRAELGLLRDAIERSAALPFDGEQADPREEDKMMTETTLDTDVTNLKVSWTKDRRGCGKTHIVDPAGDLAFDEYGCWSHCGHKLEERWIQITHESEILCMNCLTRVRKIRAAQKAFRDFKESKESELQVQEHEEIQAKLDKVKWATLREFNEPKGLEYPTESNRLPEGVSVDQSYNIEIEFDEEVEGPDVNEFISQMEEIVQWMDSLEGEITNVVIRLI